MNKIKTDPKGLSIKLEPGGEIWISKKEVFVRYGGMSLEDFSRMLRRRERGRDNNQSLPKV